MQHRFKLYSLQHQMKLDCSASLECVSFLTASFPVVLQLHTETLRSENPHVQMLNVLPCNKHWGHQGISLHWHFPFSAVSNQLKGYCCQVSSSKSLLVWGWKTAWYCCWCRIGMRDIFCMILWTVSGLWWWTWGCPYILSFFNGFSHVLCSLIIKENKNRGLENTMW